MLSLCNVMSSLHMRGPPPSTFKQWLHKATRVLKSLPWQRQQCRKLILTTYLERGSVGNVFRGHYADMQQEDIVGKVVVDGPSQELLYHEARIYADLTALQGSAIPSVHGLYVSGHLLVLVMQYAGEKFRSFSDLTLRQRYVPTYTRLSHLLYSF